MTFDINLNALQFSTKSYAVLRGGPLFTKRRREGRLLED